MKPDVRLDRSPDVVRAGEGVDLIIVNVMGQTEVLAVRTPLPPIVEHYEWRRDARWP